MIPIGVDLLMLALPVMLALLLVVPALATSMGFLGQCMCPLDMWVVMQLVIPLSVMCLRRTALCLWTAMVRLLTALKLMATYSGALTLLL